ncbi:MAG: hypothetical protein JXA37_03175 [Chloroflexia bacterium]|nr:hypothetical protein [Chloroflexia bacterium]
MPSPLTWLASKLGRRLFFSSPPLSLDAEKKEAFTETFRLALQCPGGQILPYDIPYPKWQFLRYLVEQEDVVLHGSIRGDIEVLEPRKQTDYSGKQVTAVFGSRDAIWPLFFATVDLTGYRGSLRNACWVIADPAGQEQRFYFFSLNQDMLRHDIWIPGTIYILPGASFEPTDRSPVRFDEWTSEQAIHPIARLPVEPPDFPFRNMVSGHPEDESILKTWWRYKRRLAKKQERPVVDRPGQRPGE